MDDAMADCVLPEDIILCVFTRLPVKSLVRFKCVCRQWRELFAAPKFIQMHHNQSSSDPKNESFVIYSISESSKRTMSVFSIESNDKKSTDLGLPLLCGSLFRMEFLGCCDGLLCIAFVASVGLWCVALFNPALGLSKSVWLPEMDFGDHEMISLGFGYDSVGDDFKVVRIVCYKEKKAVVGLYSAKSDSWKTIDSGFQFSVLCPKNDAIVNGNPYWVAKVDDNDVLVWFDMTKVVFKMVPLSTLKLEVRPDVPFVYGIEVPFVYWKGRLAALVCAKNEEGDRMEFVDVWVYDDGEVMWRKNHRFGPVEMIMDRCLLCSKTGKIMGKCVDEKLILVDPETGCVTEIEINKNWLRFFEICGHSESLAYIEGMEQVAVKKEEEDEEEAEGGGDGEEGGRRRGHGNR